MSLQNIREIIQNYIADFDRINREEIYKWQAVDHFQRNWNIDSPNFGETLEAALDKTGNLLASKGYLPRTMITQLGYSRPEQVRGLFRKLFDEDANVLQRVEAFRQAIRLLNQEVFPGKNDYQDMRAVSVYLALRYPNKYFFYKWGMFQSIVPLLEYPYEPSQGSSENLFHFFTLCSLVNEEILHNEQLLALHRSRLTLSEFQDPLFHILTQDIIYAATQQLKKIKKKNVRPASERLIQENKAISCEPSLPRRANGKHTDWMARQRENMVIGNLGELLVVQNEKEKLQRLNIEKVPEHVSKTQGDGLGYDILSYNDLGEEIYIEVKTTTGAFDKSFYITENELQCSKRKGDKYFLYRLYNYNFNTDSAKYIIRSGNLEDLCANPWLYKVVVKR
jgi:uncharacterized protein DUF3883